MNPNFRIERKNEVLARVPFSRASLHRYIKEGTFPPSIPLGARSVGFLTHEVDATIAAMATGKDLKVIVSKLITQRETLFENTRYRIAA